MIYNYRYKSDEELREDIREERKQKEKLMDIMHKYRNESCEKIVRYKLFTDVNESAVRGEEVYFFEDDIYFRMKSLLKEMKFFTTTICDEESREITVTGTPGFVEKFCEFFVDHKKTRKFNFEKLGELTEEEKEEIRKEKTKDLLYNLESFKNDAKAVGSTTGENYRFDQAIDPYKGTIFLEIDKEKAFVDLEKGTFEKIISKLDKTERLYMDYCEQGNLIKMMITLDYSRCTTLFDLLVKAFGRANKESFYMAVE